MNTKRCCGSEQGVRFKQPLEDWSLERQCTDYLSSEKALCSLTTQGSDKSSSIENTSLDLVILGPSEISPLGSKNESNLVHSQVCGSLPDDDGSSFCAAHLDPRLLSKLIKLLESSTLFVLSSVDYLQRFGRSVLFCSGCGQTTLRAFQLDQVRSIRLSRICNIWCRDAWLLLVSARTKRV